MLEQQSAAVYSPSEQHVPSVNIRSPFSSSHLHSTYSPDEMRCLTTPQALVDATYLKWCSLPSTTQPQHTHHWASWWWPYRQQSTQYLALTLQVKTSANILWSESQKGDSLVCDAKKTQSAAPQGVWPPWLLYSQSGQLWLNGCVRYCHFKSNSAFVYNNGHILGIYILKLKAEYFMYVVFIGGSVLALNKGCWLTLADTTTKLRMSPPPPALLFKSVILIILFSSQCSLVILDDLFRLLKVDSYRYLKALRAISKPALKKKKKRMGGGHVCFGQYRVLGEHSPEISKKHSTKRSLI